MNQTLLSNKNGFSVFLAYLRLLRPANVVTALADVTAGYSIAVALVSGGMSFFPPFELLISTACLYGGGIVFNDVCDHKVDIKERPERPIPSGKVSLINASIFGSILFTAGIAFALIVNLWCGVFALAIACLALLYDSKGKHHAFLGPINMGLCRSANLLLGVMVLPSVISEIYYIAFIPLVYIFSVTLISREEVKGGNRAALYVALFLFTLIFLTLVYLSAQFYTLAFSWMFICLLAMFVLIPLIKAIFKPVPGNVQKSVKFGVLALIIVNASLVSVFSEWQMSLIILALLPFSFLLSRLFAVT